MEKKPKPITVLVLIVMLFINSKIPNYKLVHANTNDIGNREVIVAVIDTGIDYTHEKLKDIMWINTLEIMEDGIDNDKNGYIDDVYGWNFHSNNNIVYNNQNNYDDHGTHCAGILAGIVANRNVKIKIMSLKVLSGSNHEGTIENLIKAVQYAEKMGASICNVSLGTKYNDTALKATIKESNMLFIVAAGNGKSGNDNDENPIYPASYDFENIIAVANLNNEETLHETSNYGVNSVDVAALGTDIYSTITHNSYGYMSGTSMATLSVTGLVAMLYSLHTEITLLQAKESVLNTVQVLPSLTNKVHTNGSIDVSAAIAYYAPTKISVIEKKTLKVGKTYILKTALTPIHASNMITFSSLTKEVATVNKTTGKIAAKKKGTTIITVKTQNGLTATCIVVVK